jgi:uncharacterized membrane protein YccC
MTDARETVITMTQQTLVRRPTGLRGLLHPPYRPPPTSGPGSPPWWKPEWSVAAALRAVRATVVVPGLLALTFKGLSDGQMALFAVFGSFGALVMTTFGGSRRDKLIAHSGLAVAGSVALILGTLASGSVWVAALVTLPVTFAIYFAGAAGPNAAAAVTATLLAFILPVASGGGTSELPSRLAGWWLASVVSTAAVLALSPRPAGDRLRAAAAALADALGRQLETALGGSATAEDVDATVAAKHNLLNVFDATPYRPIGLATADQGLASLVSVLEWCSSLAVDAMDGQVNLRDCAPEDRELLAESAAALHSIAGLLGGSDESPSMERIWKARQVSAAHLRSLDGDPAVVRKMADHAFYAQAIGVCASAAAADALIAVRRLDPDAVNAQRLRWLAADLGRPEGAVKADPNAAGFSRTLHALPLGLGRTVAADASMRSVWFRNSARGAAALAVAVAVAKITGVQHAFWVVLGTLSVLRTSAGATGSTALRALTGTALGFIVGAALLVGIGTSPLALWIALPVAVLVAAYSPGTMPFSIGQAAFTITVVVLFNILVPAGWKVGLLRVEDVAIGCAVSVVVGALFWPRGASAVVGDNLADDLRAGAAYLVEATRWVLGLPVRDPGQGAEAIVAGIRLDDAMRGYLTEQGSKRLDKQDLWTLAMSALRLRLTAHSLASLPGLGVARGRAAEHQMSADVRDTLAADSVTLAGFYAQVADQVDKPSHGDRSPADVQVPVVASRRGADPSTAGPAQFHPEALWVREHLDQLGSHSAALVEPARRLAELRRTPWWR